MHLTKDPSHSTLANILTYIHCTVLSLGDTIEDFGGHTFLLKIYNHDILYLSIRISI